MVVKELSVGRAIRFKNLKNLSLKNAIRLLKKPFTVCCKR